ncbi:hypothetical protein JOD54_001253 [Actinokineospora baliensis]|nr:hypothetical protein [Actinokineospora baliensis]
MPPSCPFRDLATWWLIAFETVLRYVVTIGPKEARYVEAALTAHEAEAVSSDRPLLSVSNNCTD